MCITYSMMFSFVYMMNDFFMKITDMRLKITKIFVNWVHIIIIIYFFIRFGHRGCIACKLNKLVCTYYYIQRIF